MTAAAGMVTHTAAQIILVESVALGCDVWVTGDKKSVGPRGEMSKSSGAPGVVPVGQRELPKGATPGELAAARLALLLCPPGIPKSPSRLRTLFNL